MKFQTILIENNIKKNKGILELTEIKGDKIMIKKIY